MSDEEKIKSILQCKAILDNAMQECQKLDPSRDGYAFAMTALLVVVVEYTTHKADALKVIAHLIELYEAQPS